MLELKPGVRLDNMSPQIGLAIQVAVGAWSDTWNEWGAGPDRRPAEPPRVLHFSPKFPLVITSLNDGKHSRASFHHFGHACDIRTKTLPSAAAKRWFAAELRKRLGPEFDVILEKLEQPNEHLHVEYEPKR